MIERLQRCVAADDAFELGADEDFSSWFPVPPRFGVKPRDESQCAALLREAAELKAPVVPWGGGRHQDLGNVPRPVEIVLATSQLDGIVSYDAADQTIVVRAGTRLVDVQAVVGKDGLTLPLDPSGFDRATIGGVVAANVNGPLRTGYGTPRDLVLGSRTAHSDGTVAKSGGRLVKNVTGFDLHRLYCGSLGSLAVLCELSLRLRPLPEREASVAVFCADAEQLDALLSRLRELRERPASFVVADARLLQRLGLPSVLRAGNDEDFAVMLRFHGLDLAVGRALRDVEAAVASAANGTAPAARCERVEGEALASRLWSAIREARSILDPENAGAVLKLAMLGFQSAGGAAGGSGGRHSSRLGAMIEAVHVACAGAGVEPGLLVEPELGIVRIHCAAPPSDGLQSALLDLASDPSETRLTIESAPAAWRAGRDVHLGRLDNAGYVARLKRALDPGLVMSPGRIVAGGET